MKILIHGFVEAPSAQAATVAALAGLPGHHEFAWLARGRYHHELRQSGFAGQLLDEDALAVGAGTGTFATLGPWEFGKEYGTLLLLADREGSAPNQYVADERLQRARLGTDAALDGLQPDGAIFADVPHSLSTYLVHAWFVHRNKPVAMIRPGAAGHQRRLTGRGPGSPTETSGLEHTELVPHQSTIDYVARVSSSYSNAEPKYMREQRGRGGFARRAIGRLHHNGLGALRMESIRSARTMRARALLRRRYEAMCSPVPVGGPFVTLFLHLQPERTTVPEGGVFARQVLVAEHLAQSLPEGWSLLVREHPSTFLTGPKLVRNVDFYDTLCRLPRTKLVSLSVSAFDLVDASRVVATVTGTVGLEAAIRGIPAIAFGNAGYLGCPGIVDGQSAIARGENPIESALHTPFSLDAVVGFLADVDNSPETWCIPVGSDIVTEFVSGRMSHSLIPRLVQLLLDDEATNRRHPR